MRARQTPIQRRGEDEAGLNRRIQGQTTGTTTLQVPSGQGT